MDNTNIQKNITPTGLGFYNCRVFYKDVAPTGLGLLYLIICYHTVAPLGLKSLAKTHKKHTPITILHRHYEALCAVVVSWQNKLPMIA